MFWKRKSKKKDGDEATDKGVATATVTADDDVDSDTSDGDGADKDTGTDAAERAETSTGDATDAKKRDAEEDAADERGSADSAKGDDEERDSEETAPAAKDAEDEDDADDEGDDTASAAADDDTDDDEDADEESDEDADEESDEDADEKAPAAKREEPEPEPEVPGIGEPDDEGVQRVRTAGALRVDDEDIDVVSNTWIVDVGDDGVIVIDPAHDAEPILEAVGDREVLLVACTNGYNTHIAAAVEVAERDEAPIALHRRELRAWRKVHGAEHRPDMEIEGGGSFKVGEREVDILPIPGTSAGSVAYYIAELGVVFSGDTLRRNELGTVGGGFVDYTGQLHSVGEVLLALPPDTRILPDSGPETTVGAESGNFDSWV